MTGQSVSVNLTAGIHLALSYPSCFLVSWALFLCILPFSALSTTLHWPLLLLAVSRYVNSPDCERLCTDGVVVVFPEHICHLHWHVHWRWLRIQCGQLYWRQHIDARQSHLFVYDIYTKRIAQVSQNDKRAANSVMLLFSLFLRRLIFTEQNVSRITLSVKCKSSCPQSHSSSVIETNPTIALFCSSHRNRTLRTHHLPSFNLWLWQLLLIFIIVPHLWVPCIDWH